MGYYQHVRLSPIKVQRFMDTVFVEISNLTQGNIAVDYSSKKGIF